MEELMLIENPYGMYNPRKRRRKGGKKMSRNPIKGVTKEWFQGIDAMDAGAALGGLVAATMIPGMFIKTAAVTTGQKMLKLAACAGATVATGFIFRNLSANAGKMAIAGGLAGTLSQALSMFTNINIGRPQLGMGRTTRIGQTTVPEYENVRIS